MSCGTGVRGALPGSWCRRGAAVAGTLPYALGAGAAGTLPHFLGAALAALLLCALGAVPLAAQASVNPAPTENPSAGRTPGSPAGDSLTAAEAKRASRIFAAPTRRWLPRHVGLGVGGVATSPPGSGTTYTPTMGGVFDLSVIGYLTPRVAWRAEGFVHLHDRSRADETAILAAPDALACGTPPCAAEQRETARRSSGGAIGVEYHPMRGGVGMYGVAMVGIAHSTSFGDVGAQFGIAPSLGVGVLAPMSTGVDGFALELRWRRLPTALGAVNAAVASLQLRF